MGTAVQI